MSTTPVTEAPGTDAVLLRLEQAGIVLVILVDDAEHVTELQAAAVAGLNHVNFFPAGKSGGRPMIGTLAAPFPDVRFMLSGGVSTANLADYLEQPVDLRGRRQLDDHAVTHRERAIRLIETNCHRKA